MRWSLAPILSPQWVMAELVLAIILMSVNITLNETEVMAAAVVLSLPAMGWAVWFLVNRGSPDRHEGN